MEAEEEQHSQPIDFFYYSHRLEREGALAAPAMYVFCVQNDKITGRSFEFDEQRWRHLGGSEGDAQVRLVVGALDTNGRCHKLMLTLCIE